MEEIMRDMYVVVTDYVKPNTGESPKNDILPRR